MPKSIKVDTPVIDPLAAVGAPEVQERPRRDKRGTGQMPVEIQENTAGVQTLIQPVCPSGHPVAEGMKFCAECGQQLPDPDKPPSCRNGHPVGVSDKFCASCGVPLSHDVVFSEGAEWRPRPDSELSPAELEERERLHARAINLGRENPALAYAPGQAPANVNHMVIHFVADGFTAFGVVWLRGQEIEIWPGHPRWAEAQGWINADTAEQYRRYKKEFFRPGPWPGERSYLAGRGGYQSLKAVDGEGAVPEPTDEELARADKLEQQRARRVPAAPSF